MKRFWLGAVLLAVLLAAGLVSAFGMNSLCAPMTEGLDAATAAVQQGQWTQARAHCRSARQRWEQSRDTLAALTSHEPMEEVDTLFQALEVFSRQQDAVRFAECCARLSALTGAISESQSLAWWNVL